MVRKCDAGCADGSTCGALEEGFCANGEICFTATCADGSDCGDGGANLCLDGQACQDTRFGARCASTGFRDGCDPEDACRVDAIYFGSEKDCVFALDVREPFCRVWDPSLGPSGRMKYRASSWVECGENEEPDGSVDVCGSACPDGSACGDGGTKKCLDLTPCDPKGVCEDGSMCGDGGAGRCADGVFCECPTGVCGDGGAGLCSDGTSCDDACYYAVGVAKACPGRPGAVRGGGPGPLRGPDDALPLRRVRGWVGVRRRPLCRWNALRCAEIGLRRWVDVRRRRPRAVLGWDRLLPAAGRPRPVALRDRGRDRRRPRARALRPRPGAVVGGEPDRRRSDQRPADHRPRPAADRQ